MKSIIIAAVTVLSFALSVHAETPALSDLPRKAKVSQGGITWTFSEPVPVGQFVNGDYYVVGPCTITAISPEPIISTAKKSRA